MRKLLYGIHHFQNGIFERNKDVFRRLKSGQNPETLFITCSDSRINPNLFTQTGPGELFIMRNAGNLIPPFGNQIHGEIATVEYAVSILKVKDIVVCGHSHCGAIQGLLNLSSLTHCPEVVRWLGMAEDTLTVVENNYSNLSPEDKLNVAIQENVLVQIEHLKKIPAVAAAVANDALKIHAWVYKFETGEVFSYDAKEQQFSPLLDARSLPSVEPGPIGAKENSLIY